MKKVLTFTFCSLLFFMTNDLFGQLKFKITYDLEQDLYKVSLIPEADFKVAPLNITATGQITIKVPAGAFDPVNIVNYQEGMLWTPNSKAESPTEAPDYDYISFGLNNNGASNPEYKMGEEMPLFSFQNAYGCVGAVYLMDNQNDAFFPPNSMKMNVGNQLTIFGAGGCAYKGNIGDGMADCNAISTGVDDLGYISDINTFPNPAVDKVTVEIQWEEEFESVTLSIRNVEGKSVLNQSLQLSTGRNNTTFQVAHLAPGSYWIEMIGKDWQSTIDQFVKN